MRFSLIINRYLFREFSRWLLISTLTVFALILLFDMAETMRRTSGKPFVNFMHVVEMVFLKAPCLVTQVFPFVVLFAILLSFWRLDRCQEIIVMRASGLSIWQMVMPLMSFVFLIKVIEVTTLNPFVSALYARYEYLSMKKIKGQESQFTVSENGVWMRQYDKDYEYLMRARHINKDTIKDVTLYMYDHQDQFIQRLDAQEAQFIKEGITLKDVWLSKHESPNQHFTDFYLPTNLTLAMIEESGSSPRTLSIWTLPSFIHLLEKSGLSSVKYRIYWHSLFANIVLVCSMVLLGAGFALSSFMRQRPFLIIGAGILTGFLIFFISDISYALGQAMRIPMILGAWIPALIGVLTGMMIIFHLEDR